jgi:sec-independent protein translocase protein TatA
MLPCSVSHAALSTLAIGFPGGWELAVVLVILLLLFGSRLPGVMRNLGQSVVQFKKGINDSDEEGDDDRNAESQP